MKRLIVIGVGLLLLAACATQPEEISAAYVSPLHYRNYDCEQLEMESERVLRRSQELYFSLKDEADTDEAQMAIGLILLWPTLFFVEGGDDYRAMEYSRLKGERDAIERTSIQKKCAIEFQPFAPPQKKKDESYTQE